MELQKIIGKKNVLTSPKILEAYSGDFSFAPQIRPGTVVKPKSTEEVQSIVKWANETLTPLVPVSSGSPHFNGDTVPSVDGAVIVDLSGMKQIIRVDRRNRVAMIEPGVTFGELIPALSKEGLAPLITFLPRHNKSVVTSFLERTPITEPRQHWEPMDPLLCVEAIYGNGDLIRTGSAGGAGTIEEQWEVGRAQIRGMGPSQVDFTRLLQGAQGTLGIVTWATIRCRLLPKVKKSFLVSSHDMEPLIELCYKITYKKIGDELLIMNRENLSSVLRSAGDNSAEKIRKEAPEWILYYSIDGAGLYPEDKVDYQMEESIELAEQLGLELKTDISGVKADDLSGILSHPSKDPYWKLNSKGSSQDIFFLTTLDKTSKFIGKMLELADKQQYATENIGIYLQPIMQGCNCHLEFNLKYDLKNNEEADAVKQLVENGSKVLAEMGGFFSRPYGTWNRFAYDEEGRQAILLRKLKEIFDTKGILNPGKLCY